ncbi:MAG: helix-turn-helix domain-containing protein [Corynebacterium sp.]|uniref:helix-turn-helix domain-containing protein n=1 Tax=unclassified Corynebacterium TaxID=2624378 RepID=UPI003F939A6A
MSSALLTTRQAADHLGIGVNHLRALVTAERIRGFKLPGKDGKVRQNSPLRYRIADLDAYAAEAEESYARHLAKTA